MHLGKIIFRLFAFILSVVTESMDGVCVCVCATEVIQMGVGLLTLQLLHVVWSLAIACFGASLGLFSQDYTRRANQNLIRFNTALFLFFTFLFVLHPPVLSDSSRVHLIASLDSSLSPLSLLFSLAHSLYSVPSSSSSSSSSFFFLPSLSSSVHLSPRESLNANRHRPRKCDWTVIFDHTERKYMYTHTHTSALTVLLHLLPLAVCVLFSFWVSIT